MGHRNGIVSLAPTGEGNSPAGVFDSPSLIPQRLFTTGMGVRFRPQNLTHDEGEKGEESRNRGKAQERF